ncbi:BAG family molecular chaperone regulator 5, mitochondrial [Capsicum galapagoense]
MKSSSRTSFYSCSGAGAGAATIAYCTESVQSGPKIIQIPVQSAREDGDHNAAVKIQSIYRSYVVRNLVKKISAVNSEANYLQRLIQRQETVDAVRSSERERIRMNEALMGLLLRLDSVPGVDPTVRELRRDLSRRIVGLQEILDAVSDTKIQNWDGFLMDWDDVVERMEMDVCRERGGGNELETFCAEHLGLRCLQRFLRDQ